jgi:multiple sugar transport system permease protein
MSISALKKSDSRAAWLFIGPSLSGFSIFYFIPFAGGIYYSLVDSPTGGKFIGFANYIKLLSNPVFLTAGKNTLIFTCMSVPLIMLVSLVLAVLLNRKIPFCNIFRTAFIIPLAIPVASIVLIWQIFFDYSGFINSLLSYMGLTPVDWMKSGWARLVVVAVYIWKNSGYNMVLFLAGLQNIPAEYYESAEIDGAGAFSKFHSITLVCLTPTSFFVFIMSIINSFKVFRETYLVSGEYPHDSIYMLQHYMNNMFTSLDYQKLTSAAFIMAVFLFLLVLVLFRVERHISGNIG